MALVLLFSGPDRVAPAWLMRGNHDSISLVFFKFLPGSPVRRMILACAAMPSVGAKSPDMRPPITGISHLAVYSRDMGKSAHFYTHILGARKGVDPENPAGMRFHVNARQFVAHPASISDPIVTGRRE